MQVVIGRAPTCDVVLEHLSISRQHAELTTDLAGNLFLTDLGAGAAAAVHHAPTVSARVILLRTVQSILQCNAPMLAPCVMLSTLMAAVACAAHRTNVDGVWIRPSAPRQLPLGATVRFGASTREYKVPLCKAGPAMRHAQLGGVQVCTEQHVSGGRAPVLGCYSLLRWSIFSFLTAAHKEYAS